jgi:hypothetical protein
VTKIKNNTNSKIKTSIRLALTDFLRDAFDLLKRTRYPFMKEDEILKLALSQLYAGENIPASKNTTISYIIARIRCHKSDFAKDWLNEKNLKEEDVDSDTFCDMIVDMCSANSKTV